MNRQFDSVRFRALLARYRFLRQDILLPAYFLMLSVMDTSRHYPEALGIDARIYLRAAMAFRLGEDPWQAVVLKPSGDPLHFAALPPTVVALWPFTFLPERVAVWLFIWLAVLSAFWIIRRLGLPLWWLLFPPLVQGVFVANPQILLLALLLGSSPLLAALAPMLKIYAVAPLIGERRVRAILLTGAFLMASVVLFPDLWSQYVGASNDVARRLFEEASGGYSATGTSTPLLVAALVGLGLLALYDFRAAGWLAAPALVPASQLHLSTMAMPVLARAPNIWMTVLLAAPVRGLPSAVIAVYGAWLAYTTVRNRQLGSLSR
jgi:hypothetical protein